MAKEASSGKHGTRIQYHILNCSTRNITGNSKSNLFPQHIRVFVHEICIREGMFQKRTLRNCQSSFKFLVWISLAISTPLKKCAQWFHVNVILSIVEVHKKSREDINIKCMKKTLKMRETWYTGNITGHPRPMPTPARNWCLKEVPI